MDTVYVKRLRDLVAMLREIETGGWAPSRNLHLVTTPGGKTLTIGFDLSQWGRVTLPDEIMPDDCEERREWNEELIGPVPRVAEELEARARVVFEAIEPYCGYAACAGGCAVLDQRFAGLSDRANSMQPAVVLGRDEAREQHMMPTHKQYGFHALAHYFGISPGNAVYFFDSCEYDESPTAAQVADRVVNTLPAVFATDDNTAQDTNNG